MIIVETGEDAVALAEQRRPDLILMDVQMPVLDGLAAIRLIRSFPPPGNGVPIIAMTALVMQGDKERCLEAGADAYLGKPTPMAKLAEQIQKLVLRSTF